MQAGRPLFFISFQRIRTMTEPLQVDWKAKIGCFTPNAITEKVMDKDVQFYPVSVGIMFELRTIARPLAKALGVLFSKNENDYASKNIIMPKSAGGNDQEIAVEAISEGMAKLRHTQREDAIEGIVISLTEPQHIEVVGKIIMDSMREVFPPGDPNQIPAKQFMNDLPLPALTGCLIGVGKANKGVFGPLADQVADLLKDSVDRIATLKKSNDENNKQESPQIKAEIPG